MPPEIHEPRYPTGGILSGMTPGETLLSADQKRRMDEIMRIENARQNMPRTVRLGPFDYEILDWARGDAECGPLIGNIDYIDHKIRIMMGMNELKTAEVMIHEFIHGLFHAFGPKEDPEFNKMHERLTECLGIGLTQFFRDNPKMIEHLLRLTGAKKTP
jgi:hypothetical protein